MYILPPRCKTKQKNLTGLSGLDVSHYTVDAEEIVFTSLKKMLTFQIWEECSSPFLLPTSRELKPKKKILHEEFNLLEACNQHILSL